MGDVSEPTRVALLLYVAAFLFAKSWLIRRETGLGWALSLNNLAIGLGYLYAVAHRFWPPLEHPLATGAIWGAVAATTTIAVRELVRAIGGTRAVVALARADLTRLLGRRRRGGR